MGNKGKKIQPTKPQEPSIRKSLQDIVNTLKSHDRDKISNRKLLQDIVDTLRSQERDQVSNKGIEGIATCLKIHRIIITNLIILTIIFLLIFFIYHELSKDVILIEPFEVPQELEKQGYTGKVITNKLIDKIEFIRSTAGIEMESIEFKPTWSEPQIRLEIPGGGISLNSIILYIKKFFGQEPTHIGGEVFVKDNQFYTTLRISGKPSETIPVKLKVLEKKILLKAAEHIYKSVKPFILASYLYLHKKDEKRSLETIQYILSQEPPDDDSWALNLWGVILRKQKDYKGAIDKHKRAIELDPENASSYNSLGNVFLVQGKCDHAIANYKKAIKVDPTFAFAYTNWGNALVDKEDYKGAIAKHERAIELKPKDADMYINLGFALQKKKDYKDAIANYKKAIELNPKSDSAYDNWGDALLEQKDYKGAIGKYEKAIELNKKCTSAYNSLGIALLEQQKYDCVIKKLQKAIELDPVVSIILRLFSLFFYF